jgi:hypothetical protein
MLMYQQLTVTKIITVASVVRQKVHSIVRMYILRLPFHKFYLGDEPIMVAE